MTSPTYTARGLVVFSRGHRPLLTANRRLVEAERMKTKLVNDALIMAIWKRKPAKGLLWHTDRGSQYASDSHRKLLKQHGIQQSMSRKCTNCDNAVSESFFHTLKTECVNHETLQPVNLKIAFFITLANVSH